MQAKPVIFSLALALGALAPALAEATSTDASAKPPPAIPVVLYADPPTASDVAPPIIAARNALRNDRRLEVMLFNPEAPTFVLGARHDGLSLSPESVATTDQRKAMTAAVSGNFFAVLSPHGRRSKSIDATLYEIAPVPQSWSFPDRDPDALASDLASRIETTVTTAAPAVATPSLDTPPAAPETPSPEPPQPMPEPKPEIPAPTPSATPIPPVAPPSPAVISTTPPAPSTPIAPAPAAVPPPIVATPAPSLPLPPPVAPITQKAQPAHANPAVTATPPVTATPVAAPKASPAILKPPIAAPKPPVVMVQALPPVVSLPPVVPAPIEAAPAPATVAPEPQTPAVDLPATPPPGSVLSDDARRLIATGDDQQHASDYYAAINSYRQAINLAPRAAEPRLRLAQAYLQSGMRAQAINEARRAHAIDPSNQDAQDFLTTLGASDSDETQIPTNQASVTANPKDPTAWIALGDSCWNANKLPDALAAYKSAVDLDPSAVAPQARLARFYAAQGEYGKSLTALDKAGSDGYPYALEIIASETENLFGEVDAAEELLERGESTREQCYKRLKAADKAAQGLADFVAKVRPADAYKLSHLHRQLATRLLAQDTAAWITYTETGQLQDKSIAITLEKEAVREMETAAAAERSHSGPPGQ